MPDKIKLVGDEYEVIDSNGIVIVYKHGQIDYRRTDDVIGNDFVLSLVQTIETLLEKTNPQQSTSKNKYCVEQGHNMYLVWQKDNGESVYGDHKCSRCGYVEAFQSDYT